VFFRQLRVGPGENFSYLLGCEDSRLAVVIDPSEPERILRILREEGLVLKYIINTHSHRDHCSGNRSLAAETGAQVVAHEASEREGGLAVKDGDRLVLGSMVLEFLYTPGHSPDGLSILVGDRLFTGDTLFVGECGRTDLPGGDPEALYDSLFGKILRLDDSIRVYPGHDYGDRPSSTIGYERAHNYTLKLRTREEFVRFMAEE
jgi:glyoxylase-like metal-dependent hydrolase (beta-lactamase superfamily II)